MTIRDAFDAAWARYPRKVGKLAAWAEWDRLRPDLAEVMAALDWQIHAWEARGEPQYIPHMRTWLHQGRWMDEPDVAAKVAPAAPKDLRPAWLRQVK